MKIIDLRLSDDTLGYSHASKSIRTNVGRVSGKWYWEVRLNSGSPFFYLGVANSSYPVGGSSPSTNTNWRVVYGLNGNKMPEGVPYSSVWAIGDTIGLHLDLEVGTLSFTRNGVDLGVAFSDIKTLGEVYPVFGAGGGNARSAIINFGYTPFSNSIPSGYFAYGSDYEGKILLSSGDGKYRSIKDNGVIYSDKAIIPISTTNNSNVTSDYTLSAGSSSDLAYRAIQGGTNAWQGTGWFRTVFVKKYKLGAYSIQAWSSPNMTLSTFRFMGSNDGVTWDEIDKQSGLSWIANEIKIFPLNTSIAYTHYELRDMTSLATPLTLRSFQLFEFIGRDISMLITDNATENQYLKYGTDTIALNGETKKVLDVLSHKGALGSGKTFEHTIDMSRRRVDKITLG